MDKKNNMEEKIEFLKQLGYSSEFIQVILESNSSVSNKFEENKNSYEVMEITPVDFKELVIEKTDIPPSYIINPR